MKLKLNILTQEGNQMKIQFEGTVSEVKTQMLEFVALMDETSPASEDAEPTPITNGNGAAPRRRAGRPPKAPVDTTAAAGAPGPDAPAPVSKTMLPLCTTHAGLADKTRVTPIPSEPSGCSKCQENVDRATGAPPKPHTATMAQVREVASAMISSRPDGEDVCWSLLQKYQAESVTGAEGTKALSAEHYEVFMKDCTAATAAQPAAAPARRTL